MKKEIYIVTESNQYFQNQIIWGIFEDIQDAIEEILTNGNISEKEMENSFGAIDKVWSYIEEHLCTPDFSVNYRIEKWGVTKHVVRLTPDWVKPPKC